MELEDSVRSMRFEIHLSSLISLGQTQLKSIESFPINSILFATDSGYYVTDILYKSLRHAGLVITTSRVVIDDESADEHHEIHRMREEMTAALRAIESLRIEATVALEAGETQRLLVHRNCRKSTLDKVR